MVSTQLPLPSKETRSYNLPDKGGHFGQFGGRYAPEVLMPALEELEREYARCMADPTFVQELRHLERHYVGRPTPLYFAKGSHPRNGRGLAST